MRKLVHIKVVERLQLSLVKLDQKNKYNNKTILGQGLATFQKWSLVSSSGGGGKLRMLEKKC